MSASAQRIDSEEIETLRRENALLRRELTSLRKELATDELTGLLSARKFREHLEEVEDCVENLWRQGRTPALLFIDVDRFKEVNEMHGHAAAGRLLRQIGRLIAGLVRVDDKAFRYGGDEFVVLVSGGPEGARVVGERIRVAIAEHGFRVRGLKGLSRVPLTVSMGVREFRPGDTAERVLDEADRAMFEAKRRSRNALVVAE